MLAAFIAAALLFSPSCSARGRAAASPAPAPATRTMFEFHSGFWINLHHFLYEEAVADEGDAPKPTRHEPVSQGDASVASSLSADELRIWSSAVSYYKTNVVSRDLLANDAMRNAKNRLEDMENSPSIPRVRLDPALAAVLNRAAPIYRARWWPAHDRANHAWIDAVQPLVEQHGGALSGELEKAFGALWPDQPMRVDVLAYANWAGAYTTLRPTRIAVSSLDFRNQGTAALEVLFHEASHTLIENVGNTLIRDFAARKRAAPRDLWHALLFFTVGYYVHKMYADYVPYAESNDLWEHGFSVPYEAVLISDWQPRLEGKTALEAALSHLAADLSAESSKSNPKSARALN